MENVFNYANMLRLIWKWKIHLILVFVLAAALSFLISRPMFITPLYKSTATLYPSNVRPYSDESETEQMLQLLNSKDIRDSIILKYNLGGHYGLDQADKYFVSTLNYLYGKRIKIRKTEFESVMIDVLDADPKTACNIVNSIILIYDSKVRSLQKAKFLEVVENYKRLVEIKRLQLDSIQHEIDIASGGKAPLPAPREITAEQAKAIMKNDPEHKPSHYQGGGQTGPARLVMLLNLAQSEALAFSEFKLKYDQALLDYNREYTYSNVVSRPIVADKKSSPITWVIMTLGTLGALFLALVLIAVIENRRKRLSNLSAS